MGRAFSPNPNNMRVGRPTIASAVAVVGLSLAVAACGSDNGVASGSSSGKRIALLLPEHTTARYETQDRPHFEREVKASARLHSHLREREPGRQRAAVAGRLGADAGDRRDGARSRRCHVGQRDRGQGQRAERAGDQLRPARLECGPRWVHLVRQRARREAAGYGAREQAEAGRQRQGADRDDQRRSHRQQRPPVQAGREQRVQPGRREDREVLRHSGLLAGERADRDAAGDHRPGQRRVHRRLRRQRRHCGRRDHSDEGRRHHSGDPADDGSGLRARPASSGSSRASNT